MRRVIRYSYRLAFLLLLFISFPKGVFCQITISSDDILALVGQEQTIEEDTTGSITIDFGTSSSQEQTWDFRFDIENSFKVGVKYDFPTGSVFESDFSDANLLQGTFNNAVPGFGEVKRCTYFEVTTSNLSSLGSGVVTKNPDVAFVDTRFNEIVSLPLKFNDVWATSRVRTAAGQSDTTFQFNAIANHHVDAWGTVQLPLGDFDCLRVRTNEEEITRTIVNQDTVARDTSTTINYAWVSKDNFTVCSVKSQPGETDPGFTNARDFQRLFSFIVSVQEPLAEIPSDFKLFQNYPNPFNPETVIQYHVPQNNHVELAIFNMLGQRVRTMVDEIKAAGSYDITWNATNELGEPVTGGIYYYRLKAGEIILTKKMILLQ